MTETNTQKIDPNAWKSWYAQRGEVPDDDMPMLAEMFKKRGLSKVLDVGCGTGRHTVFFAEKGFDVYSFDLQSEAVKSTQEKLKEKGVKANVKQFDMNNPFPYEDKFFGAIISTLAINHFPVTTIKKIISEIDRVTQTGGYVYLHAPSMERMLQRLKENNRPAGTKIEEGTYLRDEGDQKGIPHHFFTPEELGKFFSNYSVVSCIPQNHYYKFLAVKR